MIKDATIVVSDLHIDTWTDRPIGDTGKSKREHFFELLDWAEKVGVRELVINGDLMDFPPYKGHRVFSDPDSEAKPVAERLIQFGQRVPVTYVFGNHDIGISGYRCMAADNVDPLATLSLCYPVYVIDYHPNTTILVEHGHFCDPALLLYLRDLAKRTYSPSHFEDMMWTMQRRDLKRPDERVEPGALATVEVTPGENAYYAAKAQQGPPPRETFWSRLWSAIKHKLGRAIAPATAEWWWKHGMERMDDYIQKRRREGEEPKPKLYQIYGHTHRADPRDEMAQRGVKCRYINCGTWTEAGDEGWYLDVTPEGMVWLQDWINEPEELRRLGVP